MEQEVKGKRIRIIASMIMAVTMVLVSELSGEKEVLFPEVVALLTGAWALKRQPWIVSKRLFVVLMTESAIMGICFVRFLSCPLLVKIVLAYIITGILLTYHRSTLAPMISACILPILMGTTSVVYPVAVAVMSGLIVVGQAFMEVRGLREKVSNVQMEMDTGERMRRWCMQTAAIGVIAVLPIYLGTMYCIAPPLLVLFTEFCDVKSAVRKAPIQIGLLTCLCAGIGAAGRYVLCVKRGMPLTLAAVFAVVLVFVLFTAFKRMFPPAGALAFLALIIPESKLIWYPIEVMIGTSLFILVAIYVVAREESEMEVAKRVRIQ